MITYFSLNKRNNITEPRDQLFASPQKWYSPLNRSKVNI